MVLISLAACAGGPGPADGGDPADAGEATCASFATAHERLLNASTSATVLRKKPAHPALDGGLP